MTAPFNTAEVRQVYADGALDDYDAENFLLPACDEIDELRGKVERLRLVVEMQQTIIDQTPEALTETQATCAALTAEVERLRMAQEGWRRGCACGDDDVCAIVRGRDEAVAALRELVRLKAIKDDLTLTEINDPQVLDYERSKPAAWAEAQRVVSSYPPALPGQAEQGGA